MYQNLPELGGFALQLQSQQMIYVGWMIRRVLLDNSFKIASDDSY